MRKRLLAWFMAVCMITSVLPVSAFAVGCEHHEAHTAECGYAEAVVGTACTHVCGADCYTTVDSCEHGDNHDESCGYIAATEETEEVPCGHVCGENCKSQVLNCSHEHDAACGYVAAVEGVACKFVCDICSGTNPSSEGGEDDIPTCTGDLSCTLTEGHNEGCQKAAQDAALADCTKAGDCGASVHHADCAKGIADKLALCDGLEACPAEQHKEGCLKAKADADAVELAKCDKSLTCLATLHHEDCEYAVELAKCSEAEGCEAAVHKDTCPAYVWTCDKTGDCKAATHEEDCSVAIKAAAQVVFDEMVAALPAPETVDPLDEEMLESLHEQIAAIVAYALENSLYETQDEVTSLPVIVALLDAMQPKDLTLEMNSYTLDFSWYVGKESSESFEISTIGQLAAFAKITQNNVPLDDGTTVNMTNFSGKTVYLTASLTFGDDEYWYNSEDNTNFIISNFAGHFIGGGKTISGLKFKNTANANPALGLFGTITAAGSVSDLTVANVTAQTNTSDSFGFIARTLNGSASNCHVNGVTMNVTGYYNTCGFLFGSVSGSEGARATVSNCSVSNVTFATSGSDCCDNFGGVIGYAAHANISNCTASTINLTFDTKTKRMGGFIGNSNNTTVTGCKVTSLTITTADYYYHTGGFVGRPADNSTFIDCHVIGFTMDGNATGTGGYIGGFAGQAEGTGVSFTNCSATDLSIEADCISSSIGYVGGFIGRDSSGITATGCSASGTITAVAGGSSAYVGGFAGRADSGLTASGCDVSDVTIDATQVGGYAGGFVGRVNYREGATVTITNCEAAASVSSSGAAGGMVGYIASGANVAFEGNCVSTPSTALSGTITDPIANSADKDYTDTDSYTPCVCSGVISGYIIGFTTIQAALDAGATEITLLQDYTENLILGHDLTLNLGTFNLESTITIPDGTFTVPEDHDATKNPDDIQGITVTVTGTSTGNNIILTEPELDHHAFLGWCSSGTGTSNADDLAITGGWKADPGATYHTHWRHSSYEHLPSEQLHLDFTMQYGDQPTEQKTVTFKPSDSNPDHKITEVEQGNYFDVTFNGLVVTLTPKANVSSLPVNTIGYTDIIHVTVEDGSVHSITAKLIVNKADSSVQGGYDENATAFSGTYGDTIELTVKVARNPRVRTTGADQVEFFYNGQSLGDPVTVHYDDYTQSIGTATLEYHTTDGVIPIGENNVVTVEYSGGITLLESDGTITVSLEQKELTIDGLTAVAREYDSTTTVTVEGGILTGVVTPDDVTVASITASVADATVGENKAVTISSITLSGEDSKWYTVAIPTDLTVTITEKTVPAGETVTLGSTTVTGPASMDEDGATVAEGGSITTGSTTLTVTSGTVEVANSGTVEIPAGSTVTAGGQTITGPASVTADGNVVIGSGGTISSGDINVTVTTGPVNVKNDGTLEVPAGSIVIVDGVTITGPATVNDDGSVSVGTGGKIEIDDKEYTVTSGPVTVDNGKITVPEGSSVNDGKNIIAGPTTIDPDDTTKEFPEGSDVTVGDTTVEVTDGKVTENEDGSIEIPKDTTVTVGDATITGPATVDPDGDVTVDEGGSVTVGDNKVTVTDGSVSVDDGTVTVPTGSTVIVNGETITGPAVIDKDGVEVFYKITSGASLTVTKGNSATFISIAPFGKFVEVLVDGRTVATSNYTAVSGSTKVTLKAAYINTLSAGEHTLTIVSTDGSASTIFTVKNANTDVPATGDNEMPVLWITLFAVSAFGAVAALMPKRRKGKYQR